MSQGAMDILELMFVFVVVVFAAIKHWSQFTVDCKSAVNQLERLTCSLSVARRHLFYDIYMCVETLVCPNN